MKKYTLIAASLVASALFGASEVVSLAPGESDLSLPCIPVAVKATTGASSATVALKTIDTWASYTTTTSVTVVVQTNATASVSNRVSAAVRDVAGTPADFAADVWSRRYPFDVVLSVETNIVERATTNTWRELTSTGAVTNDLASVSVSGHYGESAISNRYIYGNSRVLVTGASPGDAVLLLITR